MGIFGKLVGGGGSASVEGRITVRHRPEGVQYYLETSFYPSKPGAAAPSDADLKQPGRVQAVPSPSSSLHSDQGYMFTGALAAGHWQVIVTSRPYVIRDGEAVLYAAPPRTHRPNTKAFEVVAGQPKHLALKIEFEALRAGAPEPPVALRFVQRIGPAIRSRFDEATALLRAGDTEGAMRAFVEIGDSPEGMELDRDTRVELRIAAEGARARCLLDLGRSGDAWRVFEALGPIDTVLATGVDPYTQWDYFATSALAHGIGKDRGVEMRRRACRSVIALRGLFALQTEERNSAEALAIDTWLRTLRVLLAAEAWEVLLAFSDDGVEIAQAHRLTSINWYARCGRIEAQFALGNGPAATVEAEALLQLISAGRITHEGVGTLLGKARQAGLQKATSYLAGVLLPP